MPCSSVRLWSPLLLSLLLVTLFGCGENSVVGQNVSKMEESQRCIDCHGASVTPDTGKSVVDEWKLSVHNTENAAGCADCHDPETGHPSSCNRCHGGIPAGDASSANHVSTNPDRDGKCAKCHNAIIDYRGKPQGGGFGVSVFNHRTSNTLTAHFNNVSSGTFPASYVSSKNVNRCRNCHNPHDTSSAIATLKAWARSGHGRTTAKPWTTYDFKSYSGDCNRCHTTTGFLKYVTTGDSVAWGAASDKTKEVLGCKACHDNYSYSVRSLPAATAKYKGGAVSFPNVGQSNICLNCHVGRESGNSVKNIALYNTAFKTFTSVKFVNSHYLAAGGIVFGEIGFEFDGRDYTDPGGDDPYRHRYIGTSDPRGNNAAAINAGPCVGCHIANKQGPGEKHTLKPYILNSTALSPTCATANVCHGATATRPAPRDQAWLNQTWKVRYQAALSALKYMLANNYFRKMYYVNQNPYFYTNATPNLTKDQLLKWHSTGSVVTDAEVSGMKNMGAAFNYNLLIHDRGGVVHNRYYTRRLIYDAIDWLDDNVMNYSVGATLTSLPGTGDTAFKADALKYLITTQADGVTYTIGTAAERY